MESIFGVDSQATNLGAVHLKRAWDVSSLLTISIQAERYQIGRRKFDRVPFQDDRGLGGIAAAKNGRSGL